jgi:hypothetical protein
VDRRPAIIATLAAIAALASSGCGAGQTIDPVATAADVTATAPGYRLAIVMNVRSDASAPLRFTANGVYDSTDRTGSLTMSGVVDGRTLKADETVSKAAVYLDSILFPDGAAVSRGKRWIRLDGGRAASAIGLGAIPMQPDPSQQLDYLRAERGPPTPLGTEVVRGVSTAHYRGIVDLNRYPSLVPASRRDAAWRSVSALERLMDANEMPFDAWIDGNHLVRRMSTSFVECVGGRHLRLSITMDLYDYGLQTRPLVPPDGQVFNLTPLISPATMQILTVGC